jgi:hypothetical protein
VLDVNVDEGNLHARIVDKTHFHPNLEVRDTTLQVAVTKERKK